MRLAGKVAVVTGASRGIGLSIARRFALEGAAVVTGSRTAPPEIEPITAGYVRTDVSKPAQAKRLIATAVERHGRLDVLVNNAGVELEATVEETSPAEWNRLLSVNAGGVFLCSKYAIPQLRRAGGGVIINIASVDAFWSEPRLAAYCASKGAVLALTRSIAIDHGADGIRCTSICPGYVATEMLDQYYEAQPDPHAARANAAAMHPVGRISTPDEVASLAVWLASDEASFANGQSFILDGGLTAGRVP